MLSLVFKSLFGGDVALGPFPKIGVLAAVLTETTTGRTVAQYESPYWVSRETGLSFVAIEVVAMALVVFNGSGGAREVHGPHSDVRFADGALYASRSPLCRFDPAMQTWVNVSTSTVWPGFEITPAAR